MELAFGDQIMVEFLLDNNVIIAFSVFVLYNICMFSRAYLITNAHTDRFQLIPAYCRLVEMRRAK